MNIKNLFRRNIFYELGQQENLNKELKTSVILIIKRQTSGVKLISQIFNAK